MFLPDRRPLLAGLRSGLGLQSPICPVGWLERRAPPGQPLQALLPDLGSQLVTPVRGMRRPGTS